MGTELGNLYVSREFMCSDSALSDNMRNMTLSCHRSKKTTVRRRGMAVPAHRTMIDVYAFWRPGFRS